MGPNGHPLGSRLFWSVSQKNQRGTETPGVVVKKPVSNAVYALNQEALDPFLCLDAASSM